MDLTATTASASLKSATGDRISQRYLAAGDAHGRNSQEQLPNAGGLFYNKPPLKDVWLMISLKNSRIYILTNRKRRSSVSVRALMLMCLIGG
jgi:hypothetical protein